MKARITFLHKTELEWNKLNFKPEAGEIIVYDPDNNFNYSRVKLGDGIHLLNELPFFIEAAILDRKLDAIDGGRIEDMYSIKKD